MSGLHWTYKVLADSTPRGVILKEFASGRPFTITDLANRTGMGRDEILPILRSFVSKGMLKCQQVSGYPSIYEVAL